MRWLRLGWDLTSDLARVTVVIALALWLSSSLMQVKQDPVWEMRRQQDKELKRLTEAQLPPSPALLPAETP
jgi:hypothetical protein